MTTFSKDIQYFKFSAYGFLKNLRFFDAFLLLFFLENGISYSQIGVLYAAREIVINIAEVPSGLMADVYGRKNALVLAFVCYILSFLAFYFSGDFALLFFAMILYGIGDAFRSGTHKGMIMDYLTIHGWKDQKVSYYGHTRSWSQRGSALSALAAGILVLYTGSYRIVFLYAIVPYLLNFFNVLSYPHQINHPTGGKKKDPERSIISVFKRFWKAVKNKSVFRVVNSAAMHSSFLKANKDYIQLIMVQVAILLPFMDAIDIERKSGLVIGIIYFVIYLLTSLASRNAYKVLHLNVEHIPKKTLLLGLLAGLTCGTLIYLELWILALFAFISIYILENIRKPILTGELADKVQSDVLTSVLSAQSLYGTLLTSTIAILLGVFADLWGIGLSLAIISLILLAFGIIIRGVE